MGPAQLLLDEARAADVPGDATDPGRGGAQVRGDAPGRGGAAGRGDAPVSGGAPVGGGAPVRGDMPVRGGAPVSGGAPSGAGTPGGAGTSGRGDGPGRAGTSGRGDGPGRASTRIAALGSAVTTLVATPIDELSDPELDVELDATEDAVRRLRARQLRLVEAKRSRLARSKRELAPHDVRAGERAAREINDELVSRFRWTRSEAKQATSNGRHLDSMPELAPAFDAGQVPPINLRRLRETLDALAGEERQIARDRLGEAAAREDPVTFGATCRRLLAELDHDAATHAETRRRFRRRLSIARTPDGMMAISGMLSGLDAGEVATAIEAFRQPDPPGATNVRTPEQRTADALVEVCRAALRSGDAPTVHGVRPHVVVTLDHTTYLAQAGAVDVSGVGALPFSEIRSLLADCGVSRILTDPEGLPVESGPEVRNVPVGLYRALVIRDGGCIAVDCDAPPSRCDVMHIDIPHRQFGTLTIETAALGCRRDHRRFDRGSWEVSRVDDVPVLHPPGWVRPPGWRPRRANR
jgi:hypothetical protein